MEDFEYFSSLFVYDPETGVLTWKIKTGRVNPGDRAGWLSGKGYLYVKRHKKAYKTSRIAYLLMTGKWPDFEVDHKNRIKNDDRWDNLRPATHAENMRNQPFMPNNTSGVTGVGWHKRVGQWQAYIALNNKQICLGYFRCFDDAVKARKDAEKKYFGEFNPT